ncbi:MAG: hypothetical protein OER90_18120, partial [Gemmatimonadota bacterium]|nr:hypothetical protein [Gemmatimonadota bacterium]
MRSRHIPIATLCCLLVSVPAIAQESIEGRWEGAILVLGTELGFSVDFATAETLSATMDIPVQNAFRLPLQEVGFDSPRVHFELMGGPGLAVFDGALVSDSIGGSF